MTSVLPGLNHVSTAGPKSTTVDLEKGSEWRFEVGFDSKVVLKVVEGLAEVFGTELPIGVEYTFTGRKAAIYTWHGCKFEYTVEPGSSYGIVPSSGLAENLEINEYVSDDTPMPVYANLHFALEGLRPPYSESLKSVSAGQGPSVLVLGPPDSGKSSLCKILVSYANKQGRFPVLVNLSPQEGAFTVPGALCAAPISDVLDVEEGWGNSPVTGGSLYHPKQPLSYYYGLESHLTNLKYYKYLVSRLAVAVHARTAADNRVRSSGVIIDTPGSLEKDSTTSYSTIASIVADFNVTCIVVVGQERLYSALARKFQARNQNLTILKVPKSGGAVDREDTFMRAIHKRQIREYFYGSPKQPLSPYTVTVDYSLITVYRMAEDKLVNTSSTASLAEPEEESDSTPLSTPAPDNSRGSFLIKLEPSTILQNCVMAVLNAERNDPPEVLVESEVQGFVHVVDADDTKKKLRILMPLYGRLPNKPFLIGDYRYHE